MGLDVGSKVIGVALSDPLQIIARPLTTLARGDESEEIEQLLKLIDEYEVEGIVVGRPTHLSGKRSATLELIERFIQELTQGRCLTVIWSDERLSSKEAEELMKTLGIAVKQRRAKRDEFAAALILQWHLDAIRSS